MSGPETKIKQSSGLGRYAPDLLWNLGYLGFYVLLDWVSYVEPYGNLDITPWNPPPGLSLAFLLLRGLRFSPLLYLAALLSDLVVRGFAAPLVPTLLADLLVAGGYSLAAWLLVRVFRISPRLNSIKDVLTLLGLQIPTALAVAAGYVAIYYWAGTIPGEDVGMTTLRFWIGDMIGVAIFAPLFLSLVHGSCGDRAPHATPWVNLLQGLSILLALWIVFGGDLSQHPTLYYPLFMPLVWVGAWHGMRGVTVALFATQIVMIVAIEEAHLNAETLTEVQFFLLALALTSLLLGAIASERRRDRAALHDSQARLQTIVSVTPEGVLILDAAGRVESLNPAFENLCGRRPEDLIGQEAAALFPELAAYFENGGETQLRRPDGSTVRVALSIGRAELSDGRLQVVSLHDMSKHTSPSMGEVDRR
jgi:PAS domain S-box-containing protein